MNALQSFIACHPGGFITDKDLPALIALDRLCPLLVRCGGCRFTCGAQDVSHLLHCIKAGGDYVRDISLPVGSFERAATWQPDCPVTPVAMLPASFVAPKPAKAPLMRCERGGHDGTHVYVGQDAITHKHKCCCGGEYFPVFNEADCGGTFDGSTVGSDADPGL